jgi:dihydroorotate dehydrogenase (fumarate)
MITNLSKTGIKGLVMFNRFYTPDFDINNFSEKSSNTFSTPAEAANVLRWVAIMSGRINIDIAASTGIHDGKAVIKQLLAGATAVQIVSSIYNSGVGHLQNVLFELGNWMDTKGFNTIADFRGKLCQEVNQNPAAFERIQFMKYFSEII